METATAVVTAPARREREGGGAAERVFLDLLDRHLTDDVVGFTIRGERVDVGNTSGDGVADPVALTVHNDRFFERVLSAGNLGLGEAYMDGDWDMEEGDIGDLLTILLRNRLDQKVKGDTATAMRMVGVQLANMLRPRHWGHAQFHYDQGDDLFQAFLDPDHMMYSCGYQRSPDDSAEQLQANKLERICRKLGIREGDRLLDIGCGFGGMLIYAAKHFGAIGVGITTSRRHQAFGTRRIADAGLSDRVTLELRDHTTVEGQFDRVVSIGMFEHLPRKEYGRFFDKVAAVLPRHGTALLHVVGTNGPTITHDPFTQKYTLPGTGTPRLSDLAGGFERHRLAIWDVENMVRHYVPTSQRWLERFRANKHTLDQQKYDARFQRMWEYYLSCTIAGAGASEAALYQVLVAKDYAAPMPMHRV